MTVYLLFAAAAAIDFLFIYFLLQQLIFCLSAFCCSKWLFHVYLLWLQQMAFSVYLLLATANGSFSLKGNQGKDTSQTKNMSDLLILCLVLVSKCISYTRKVLFLNFFSPSNLIEHLSAQPCGWLFVSEDQKKADSRWCMTYFCHIVHPCSWHRWCQLPTAAPTIVCLQVQTLVFKETGPDTKWKDAVSRSCSIPVDRGLCVIFFVGVGSPLTFTDSYSKPPYV